MELKGVILFLSQILFLSLIQKKAQHAGSSFNILTQIQLVGKEDLHILQPSMQQYLADCKEIFEGRMKPISFLNSKVWIYNMHDRKFLYLITQYSMWNYENNPFLICKCIRSNNKVKRSYECSMWDDTSYLHRQNISQRKWNMERQII